MHYKTGALAAGAALLATATSFAATRSTASSGVRPSSIAERDLVAKTCTGCHTAGQYSGMRLTGPEWQAIVTKMIGLGANVPADKEQLIVGYLARSYPSAK